MPPTLGARHNKIAMCIANLGTAEDKAGPVHGSVLVITTADPNPSTNPNHMHVPLIYPTVQLVTHLLCMVWHSVTPQTANHLQTTLVWFADNNA